MTWNYRIVKQMIKVGDRERATYGLHEVYYNEDGTAWAMTENATSFGCDLIDSDEEAREQVVGALECALKDAKKHPIFIEPEKWAKPDHEPTKTIKVRDSKGNVSEYYCPKCKGIINPCYEWRDNPTDDDCEAGRLLHCYSCCHEVKLEELNLTEVREDEESESDSSDISSDSTVRGSAGSGPR